MDHFSDGRPFRDIWTQLQGQSEALKTTLLHDIKNTEAEIEKLLDRIGRAESEGVISAYEKRIAALEKDKLAMNERLENTGAQKRSYRELFEHAMLFLSNPRALWDSGRFEYRQTVLKLCFAQAPQCCRNEGFRTPVSAYPFRLLRELCGCESQVAETEGESSNSVFEILSDWEACLQAENIDLERLQQ